MLSFFRAVDRAADKSSRAAFSVAGSVVKFLAQEMREHPVTTPIVMLGVGMSAVEAYAISSRWDKFKRHEETYRQLAELAIERQPEHINPEAAESDR